jgi:hypothetical protein
VCPRSCSTRAATCVRLRRNVTNGPANRFAPSPFHSGDLRCGCGKRSLWDARCSALSGSFLATSASGGAEISFRWSDNAVWWIESSLRSPPPPVPLTGGGVLSTTGHYRTLPSPPLQSPALHCASAARIAGPAATRGCGFGGDDCASCWWSLARRRCRSEVSPMPSARGWFGGGLSRLEGRATHAPAHPAPLARGIAIALPSLPSPPARLAEQCGKCSPPQRRQNLADCRLGHPRIWARREELGKPPCEDLGGTGGFAQARLRGFRFSRRESGGHAPRFWIIFSGGQEKKSHRALKFFGHTWTI